MNFQVAWIIDIEADSHEDAAKRALAIQRDRYSAATVFEVTGPDEREPTQVDLTPEIELIIDA